MSKETILKEFDEITTDEEGLILSGLDLLTVRDFLIKSIDQTKKETREETIKEIEKKIVKYIDENKKKNFNNRELIGYEILDLIN